MSGQQIAAGLVRLRGGPAAHLPGVARPPEQSARLEPRQQPAECPPVPLGDAQSSREIRRPLPPARVPRPAERLDGSHHEGVHGRVQRRLDLRERREAVGRRQRRQTLGLSGAQRRRRGRRAGRLLPGRDPGHLVQVLVPGGRLDPAQLLRRRPLQRDPPEAPHQTTVRVVDVHLAAERFGAPPGPEPGVAPQREVGPNGQPHGFHPDRHEQPRCACPGRTRGHRQRLQARIQDAGVQTEGRSVLRHGRRRLHPGKRFPLGAPRRGDPAKARAEPEAEILGRRVERADVHRFVTPRLDGLERIGGPSRLGVRQLGLEMQPPAIVGPGRSRVDPDTGGRFALAHHRLERHLPLVVEQHRLVEDDVAERERVAEPGRPGSGQCRLQKRRHRHHHAAVDPVIAQERRRIGADDGLEERAVHRRRSHAPAHQRMTRRRSARPPCRRLGLPEPEAATLEGIGRERYAPPAAPRFDLRPSHGRSACPERRQGSEQGGPHRPRSKGGQPGRLFRARGLSAQADEGRGGSDLQKIADPAPEQRLDAGLEAHGLARMAYPVVRIGSLAERRHLAGDVGHQRKPRRRKPHPGGLDPQRLQHRLDQRRVEGVRHGQIPALHARRRQPAAHLPDRVRFARDDHAGRRVEARDRHPVGERRQRLPDPALVRQDGRHGAVGGKRLHQGAARRHQPHGVLQFAGAGEARPHVLAQAVAEHRGRLHAPGAPQDRQRVLEREQRGLGVPGLAQPLGILEHDVEKRAVELAVQQRRALVQRLAKDRLRLVQLPAHPHMLRALTGEEEGHPRPLGPGHLARRRSPRALPAGEDLELFRAAPPDSEPGAPDAAAAPPDPRRR